MLIDPMVSLDRIDRDEANRCLVAWGHRMGPILRPEYRAPADYGLRHHGELVAVVCNDSLIRDTCQLSRSTAFELSRLCAVREHICRAMLRMWREFVFPDLARSWGTPWALSYQNAAMHNGDLYRFDGWVKLDSTSGGGDPRAVERTVSGGRRNIWGWHADAGERIALQVAIAAAREAEKKARSEKRKAA